MVTTDPAGDERDTHPRGPKGLSRDLIVAAALDYIDQHGAQRLTMRALAETLHVEAMSLYRYISGREDLLEAVVAQLLSGVAERIDAELAEHWQGYLQSLANEIRSIAVDHPAAFPLVATKHPSAPWLRPPLRSLELVERFLATLVGKGFSDDQAVQSYQYFSSFLLGQLLLESVIRGAETSPVEEPLDEGNAQIAQNDGRVDLSGSPTIARLRTQLSIDRSQQQFETSLERLLDQIELDISQ